MFGVIGMFEVILRNAIYNHYKEKFSDAEWIVEQASADKLLEHEANEIIPICFDSKRSLSTEYVRHLYSLTRTYIEYMGYDADKVLKIVEKPDGVLRDIDALK